MVKFLEVFFDHPVQYFCSFFICKGEALPVKICDAWAVEYISCIYLLCRCVPGPIPISSHLRMQELEFNLVDRTVRIKGEQLKRKITEGHVPCRLS